MAKTETLIDDFDTDKTVTLWGSAYGGTNISGGRLTLPVPANTAVYAGLDSKAGYDLTSSYAYMECTPPTQPGAGTREFTFEFIVDASNKVQMYMSGSNTIVMRFKAAGVNSDATVALNAVSMRWWRMRESAGSLFWDTSPDGKTWTQRRTAAHTMTLTAGTLSISAGAYGTTETASNGFVYNVNTLGVGDSVGVLNT